MRFVPRFSIPVLAAAAALLPLGARGASPHQLAAQMITTATTVEWQTAGDHAAMILSLQRPDGQVVTEAFGAGSNPTVRVENLSDGLYSYELRTAEGAAAQSGTFTVRDGAVVPRNARENFVRGPLKPSIETFFSDFVSAAGGLCGGADCTSTESMGTATIKGKANNVRLKFEDTSTSPGFPTTDWQISANDTFSGGANKLFVEDLTAGTTPFTIEGATPTNTLYVDSTGRIGVNTSLPARTLQLTDAVVPAIRMENTTSPLQNWEVIGSNNQWYVRDVNHEGDPFIIKVAAPGNSLVIDASGRIGLGVNAPAYQIQHSSGARLDAGVWVDASSRKFKQDIHDLDRDAAFDALHALQPVTFEYKSNPTDLHCGFIAEDVPELVATPDRTGLAPMDIVAVLTKVVKEQDKTIADLRARLERLERQK